MTRTRAAAAAATSAAAASRATPPEPAGSIGALSDSKCREHTGHGLDHWFALLDRVGATEYGHTAAARHLHEMHDVDRWYAQAITVAYERARGVRARNQRGDGAFEVSVSKVMAGTPAAIVAKLAGARARAGWSKGVDRALIQGLAAALAAPASKGFVLRPDGLARYRYKWGDTTVEFRITPRPGGKTSVVVQQMKLASAGAVEERRAQWKDVLTALAKQLDR